MKLSKADIYRRDFLRYRRIQELIQELDSLIPGDTAFETTLVREMQGQLVNMAEFPSYNLFCKKQCPFVNGCIMDMSSALSCAFHDRRSIPKSELIQEVDSWAKRKVITI